MGGNDTGCPAWIPERNPMELPTLEGGDPDLLRVRRIVTLKNGKNKIFTNFSLDFFTFFDHHLVTFYFPNFFHYDFALSVLNLADYLSQYLTFSEWSNFYFVICETCVDCSLWQTEHFVNLLDVWSSHGQVEHLLLPVSDPASRLEVLDSSPIKEI